MPTRRQTLSLLGAGAAIQASGCRARGTDASQNDRLAGDLWPVHDPCIVKGDGLYHVFSTSQMKEGKGLIHWRTSPDLVTWAFKGAVMPAFPQWVTDAVPDTKGAWAPDVSFSGGRYRLYYAASTFGGNRSVIGLMTTPTLDTSDPRFGWRDEGLVIESHPTEDFNAIDPNHVVDENGRHWLAFGSFWSGLKLIELDPTTGKPFPGARPLSIARRPKPDAIEAPFIIRRGVHYYLFASYDFCCRGADSSYYTVCGRAADVTGPYADSEGKAMSGDAGTAVLTAGPRWKGPGHCAVLEEDGRFHIVYHAYDADNGGRPTLRIQELTWTADGWPVAGAA